MGTIRKVGARWRVEVRHKDFYRSGGFDTRTEASEHDSRWETEYLIKRDQGFEPHTLGAAIVRYVKEVSIHKKGRKWEENRGKAFLRDEYLLCAKVMHEIVPADFEKLINKRQTTVNSKTGKIVSSSTINRDLNFLSAVFQTAVQDWKWAPHNVIHDLRRPKDPPPRDRRISDGEIDRIIAELNGSIKDAQGYRSLARMFLVALETGMRLGELCALTEKDVYLREQYVSLRDSKNGDARDVPLSRAATAYMGEQLAIGLSPVFGMTSDTASTLFGRIVKKAGINNLHFHDTRHEAVTRLARKVDVLDLARIIGHRDINSLRRYYNATASEIAQRLG